MPEPLKDTLMRSINRSVELGHQEVFLRNGPVNITFYPAENIGIIDVVADTVKSPYKLRKAFDDTRGALPFVRNGKPITYLANPDTPQKQNIYKRWFKGDKNITPSGDKGMAKIGREGFVIKGPKNVTSNKSQLKTPKKTNRARMTIGDDLKPQRNTFMDPGGYAPPIDYI